MWNLWLHQLCQKIYYCSQGKSPSRTKAYVWPVWTKIHLSLGFEETYRNYSITDQSSPNFVKVHIFWEGHKILRNIHLTFDWHYIQSKVRRRFRKILWPSQNIWALWYLIIITYVPMFVSWTEINIFKSKVN